MRANAWEGIGKELKIKRKFYVSSRDVGIVYPRLKTPTTGRGFEKKKKNTHTHTHTQRERESAELLARR